MAFPVTLNGRTYTLTDFEGTNYVDGLPDAFEDFVTHAGDIYNSTSTTSNSIGAGSKTFTVEANKPYQAGTPLRIADAAAPSTNFLDTVVTSYSGTTLVVNSIGYGGSGTKTSWTVNIGGAKTVDGTLGLSQGGTGATDAAGARTNIDVYSKADADSRFLNVSGEASDVVLNGDLTVDTDTLYVDSANNRVGINTTSPSAELHVNSGAANFTGLFESTDAGATITLIDNGTTGGSAAEHGLNTVGDQLEIRAVDNLSFETNGAEAMRVLSNGSFLVGTDSAINLGDTSGNGFQVNSGGQVNMKRTATSATQGLLHLNNIGTAGRIIEFYQDGSETGSIGTYNGDFYFGQGAAGLISNGGSPNILPYSITSNDYADASINLGQHNVRWENLWLSGGVYLGGTGSNNLLNDYEHGFFTPTYTGGTTNPSGVTYDPTVGNEGYYVKIGRAVFIQINIRTDAISSVGAGDLRISGLPFASSSVSGQGGFGSFAIGQAADFAGEAPDSGYVSEGATHITLFYRSSFNGSSSTSQCSDLATSSNDNLIRLSGTYYSTE